MAVFNKVCLRRLEKAFLLFSVEGGRADPGVRSKVNILKKISPQCQNVRDFVRLPNLAHGNLLLPPLGLVLLKLQRVTLVVGQSIMGVVAKISRHSFYMFIVHGTTKAE